MGIASWFIDHVVLGLLSNALGAATTWILDFVAAGLSLDFLA